MSSTGGRHPKNVLDAAGRGWSPFQGMRHAKHAHRPPDCYPCLRYELSPMNPGWTFKRKWRARGLELPTFWFIATSNTHKSLSLVDLSFFSWTNWTNFRFANRARVSVGTMSRDENRASFSADRNCWIPTRSSVDRRARSGIPGPNDTCEEAPARGKRIIGVLQLPTGRAVAGGEMHGKNGWCATSELGADFTLTRPILILKALDASKLALVVGYKNVTKCDGLGGDEQIIRANRFSALFQPSSKQSISGIRRSLEW
jgi:hypothetical protein